ncbi:hypothetical protein GQ607_009814 [Colletotrichum asianum]|uniref:Secreted protein n=1 Tax=Colletotrichum asianum TaxID=702518 RepID=A0A8H3ZTK1_9PEZI|nr:hypothetical protein GQ607_009814 [Colletotrichum asianum]
MRSTTFILVVCNVQAIFAACRTVVQPCTNFQTCYGLEMQSTCASNEHVGSGSCQSITSAANSYVTVSHPSFASTKNVRLTGRPSAIAVPRGKRSLRGAWGERSGILTR